MGSKPRRSSETTRRGPSASVSRARRRGRFITFEGPEGGGKSTQIQRLASRLHEIGHQVAVTREPGGTEPGERIRTLLLDPAVDHLRAETEAFLVLAARSEHVARLIRPELDAGVTVLCDRYSDATRAYQGYGGGLELGLLDRMIETATGGLAPDLTLLFDLPVEDGLARRRDNDDEWTRFDAASLAFHRRVREGYLEMASREPERWVVIDASAHENEVESAVWKAVSPQLEGGSEGETQLE